MFIKTFTFFQCGRKGVGSSRPKFRQKLRFGCEKLPDCQLCKNIQFCDLSSLSKIYIYTSKYFAINQCGCKRNPLRNRKFIPFHNFYIWFGIIYGSQYFYILDSIVLTEIKLFLIFCYNSKIDTLEIPTPDPDIKRRHSNPSQQTGKRNFVPTG